MQTRNLATYGAVLTALAGGITALTPSLPESWRLAAVLVVGGITGIATALQKAQ